MEHKKAEKAFREYLLLEVKKMGYVRMQYFTDLHEFITTMAVVKAITGREQQELVTLSSGETVPLSRIVRVNDEVAPQYEGIMDFTCDC